MSVACSIQNKCGGCAYMHLSYQKQLEIKQKEIETLYPKHKVEPIIGMETPYYYRHKVYASFKQDKQGKLQAGLYEEESHHIIPITSCMIQHPLANRIIETFLEIANQFHLDAYHEDTGKGIVRHLYIRISHAYEEALVTIVIGSPTLPKAKEIVAILRKKHPEIKTILLNFNKKHTSQVLGPKENILYGNGSIQDRLDNLTFEIGSQSFYQVNPEQTERLYEKAISFANLNKKDTVLDACCGLGTISLFAAKKAGFVTGVELSKQAIQLAKANAKKNHFKNTQFYAMDIEEFLKHCMEAPDVLFLDPPRSGMSRISMQRINQLQPSRIVYISCYPETQKRDIQQLKNYHIEKIQPVDMFPWSKHIETIVLLQKLNS